MALSVRQILAPLDPHWDRIVRRPLSAGEIEDLERQVGLPVPGPLREFLMEVGFFQDLTWGTSAIELHASAASVAAARTFLNTLLPPQHAGLFPLGGDGAGNEYCLPSGEGSSTRIQFVDHETRKVSARKEFGEWLESVVARAIRGIRKRPPNERKVWSVQFSLPGVSFARLVELLGSVGEARGVDEDWMPEPDGGAEVRSSLRRFELNGEPLVARQLDYEGWSAPQLYFDLREPLQPAPRISQIRQLDALFKAECPGYRLCDYGAIDREALA